MWSFFSRDPSKDFPYEIGEPISNLQEKSVWTLHKAKKKVCYKKKKLDGKKIIIFFCRVL